MYHFNSLPSPWASIVIIVWKSIWQSWPSLLCYPGLLIILDSPLLSGSIHLFNKHLLAWFLAWANGGVVVPMTRAGEIRGYTCWWEVWECSPPRWASLTHKQGIPDNERAEKETQKSLVYNSWDRNGAHLVQGLLSKRHIKRSEIWARQSSSRL